MSKIVVVNHSAELGGAEIGLCNMIERFDDDIIPVVLEDGPLLTRLRALGCSPVVLPEVNTAVGQRLVSGHYDPRRAIALRRAAGLFGARLQGLLRSTGTRTVMFNSSRATLIGSLAGTSNLGVNRIVMVRDSPRPPYLSQLRSMFARFAIDRVATTVVANSSWTAQQLGVSNGQNVRVIAPFLEERFFTQPSVPSCTTSPLRVLILGRIAPWKGQLLGLSALSRVDPAHISHITVAGAPWFQEESYLHRLQEQANKMADYHVRFAGHVEDVVALIDCHDIILHTSVLPEPFGQVVVQAMARGRIVIAADDGGPQEIITHLHDGLTYRPGDAQSLLKCLEFVLRANGDLGEMSSAAAASSKRYHPIVSEIQLRSLLSELENPARLSYL